ncbi:hypothetical protein ACMA1I_15845 [Pontibacter sp. 13R65]|uniref:hypothetical protein n=1 Tax=Pontibacter sp. 13R65 TaxID=3127458 RepID=UPI00301C5B81
MKRFLLILLTAVLPVGYSSAAQPDPNSTPLSYSDVTYLIQRIAGNWYVDKSTWHPEIKKMTGMAGTAIHQPASDIIMHEQLEISEDDGTSYIEEGTLRYSMDRNQFEFVKLDPATGKELTLYTGHYYPEFKTILLTGEVLLKKRKAKIGQHRYIFLDNGSFIKIIHYTDKKGDLHMGHRYHYTPAGSVASELQ